MGDDAGAQAFKGKETVVADLRGKFMMPGIVSSHEHPLMVMGLFSGLLLEYTEDAGQMLASLKEYVENNPDAPSFSFGGSYEGRVEIYRQDIDKVVPDKPFLVIAASGHGGWCSTKALEAAGVTKDTPDPIDSSPVWGRSGCMATNRWGLSSTWAFGWRVSGRTSDSASRPQRL